MDIFGEFVSNTLASHGNQTYFINKEKDTLTGYVFSSVFKGGTYEYIFAYSGLIDSTFGDGSKSACNDSCAGWKIESLQATVTDHAVVPDNTEYCTVSFNGETGFSVPAGLIFSDPLPLTAEKGQYICLKIRFSGNKIPYHEESIMPVFSEENGSVISAKKVPLPVFTGIKRKAGKRIAFIGDSITQGCGTPVNGYKYYSAFAADILGDNNSYWNLGLGYARASDASTDGIWLYRAKQNDIVTVCFGVNDILQGHDVNTIKSDLEKTVRSLKTAGVTVILQTVPPFDYDKDNELKWRKVNSFIKNELSETADEIFDTVPILSADGKDSPASRFGSHPDENGHRLWAEKLAPVIAKYL